jgi:hypothetical protein
MASRPRKPKYWWGLGFWKTARLLKELLLEIHIRETAAAVKTSEVFVPLLNTQKINTRKQMYKRHGAPVIWKQIRALSSANVGPSAQIHYYQRVDCRNCINGSSQLLNSRRRKSISKENDLLLTALHISAGRKPPIKRSRPSESCKSFFAVLSRTMLLSYSSLLPVPQGRVLQENAYFALYSNGNPFHAESYRTAFGSHGDKQFLVSIKTTHS